MHNGYALGPINQTIKKDMLNTWQKEGYKESSVKKLITSFSYKKIMVLIKGIKIVYSIRY